MYTVKIIINKQYRQGKVSPLLYGSFVEHMGRVVYTGIYEPEHPEADEDGFRKDVLKKTKELGVTCVRYPEMEWVIKRKDLKKEIWHGNPSKLMKLEQTSL